MRGKRIMLLNMKVDPTLIDTVDLYKYRVSEDAQNKSVKFYPPILSIFFLGISGRANLKPKYIYGTDIISAIGTLFRIGFYTKVEADKLCALVDEDLEKLRLQHDYIVSKLGFVPKNFMAFNGKFNQYEVIFTGLPNYVMLYDSYKNNVKLD
ncbi:MAG: hypothetical protein COA71_14730 [SAR86 cluster bacterium]|uniref:Uncharacterized protein n=1 Tax=SAR86 cluster bacterium TaxID=2030880 RepID=A0A2A5C6A6_9GAMM|nr:MAG: hypothetical protein COA71_14730 [SAR86 cluster bacterium]